MVRIACGQNKYVGSYRFVLFYFDNVSSTDVHPFFFSKEVFFSHVSRVEHFDDAIVHHAIGAVSVQVVEAILDGGDAEHNHKWDEGRDGREGGNNGDTLKSDKNREVSIRQASELFIQTKMRIVFVLNGEKLT